MTGPPRNSDASGDTEAGSRRGSPPRMPRWVMVSGIVVGVLVLLFIVLQLTGLGGQHGPGRHLPGGGAPPAVTDVQTPASGHAPPAGGHG
jgi:hypothetical protein